MGGSGEDDNVTDHLHGRCEVVVGVLRVLEVLAFGVESPSGETDVKSACHCHRNWYVSATAKLLEDDYYVDMKYGFMARISKSRAVS